MEFEAWVGGRELPVVTDALALVELLAGEALSALLELADEPEPQYGHSLGIGEGEG